jgi:hypothetical protein
MFGTDGTKKRPSQTMQRSASQVKYELSKNKPEDLKVAAASCCQQLACTRVNFLA